MIKLKLGTLFCLLTVYIIPAFPKLPEEYKLLIKYRETKNLNARINIAKRIIEKFPSSVFINDLKIFLAKDLLKKGNKKEAKRVISTINRKRIRYDLIKDYVKLLKGVGNVTKHAVIDFPEHFITHLDRFQFSQEEAYKIAKRLYRLRLYSDTKKFIDRYYPKYENLCYIEAQIFYRSREYNRAFDILENCKHQNRDKLALRIFLKNKKYDKALFYIETISKNKGEMYLFAGRYIFRDGFPMLSKTFLEKAKYGFEKFFFLGLVNYAEHNYEEALHYFKKAMKVSPTRKKLSQASFWVYKSLIALGQTEENPSGYLVLSSIGEGFYSAISKVYLGKSVATVKALKADYEVNNSHIVDILREIKKAGFLHYMRLEAFKRISNFTKKDIILLSKEDPYLALKIALRKWGADSDIYRAVSYVYPHKEIVLKLSEKYSVDPYLVYAIMRQESLFDPYAISRAGAKGLMQLMDKTARWMSRKYKIRLRNIFDIRTNIELGIAYLSYLHKIWDHDIVKVIASYNAGENAVKRWRKYNDIYLFIESIPYPETRNYVKKVLYNFYIYSDKDLN